MPLAATVSALTNTGTEILPYSLVWFESDFSGGTGEIEDHAVLWDLDLPTGHTWTATRHAGKPSEATVDVTADAKGHDIAVIAKIAGTITARATVLDGAVPPASDTSADESVTVLAESAYDTVLWLDSEGTATNGVTIEDSFTDTADTALTSHTPQTNHWGPAWQATSGTFNIDGGTRAEAQSRNGSGYSIAGIQTFSTNYDARVIVRYPTGTTANREVAGVHFRIQNDVNFLKAGIDQIDATNRVRLESVIGNTPAVIANASFGAPSVDTDYEVYVRNEGDSIKVWVALASTGVDPENDTPLIDTTTTALNTHTIVGFGGREASTADTGAFRGPVLFDDFSVTVLDSGNGTTLADAISDTNLFRTIMASKDWTSALFKVQPRTTPIDPTGSLSLRGINAVLVNADPTTPVVVDASGLPDGDSNPLFGFMSSGTHRRCGFFGPFRVTDPSQVSSGPLDLSSASVLDISTDEITVPSAFYAAVSTADKVSYINPVGSTPVGLTNDAVYFIIKTASPNVIKLATSAANAIANTAINITSNPTSNQHLLIRNGGKNLMRRANTNTLIDCYWYDIDFAAGYVDYAWRGYEATGSTSSRIAFIDTLLSQPKLWRYGYGSFSGDRLYLCNFGCNDTSTERCVRADSSSVVTIIYPRLLQRDYTGKNPIRLQGCTKGYVGWGVAEGEFMSFGGDSGNPEHVRVEGMYGMGCDVFKDGSATDSDISVQSCIFTDDNARATTEGAPTGATVVSSGGLGFNSQAAVDRARFRHNTIIARGVVLARAGNFHAGGPVLFDNGVFENNVNAIIGDSLATYAIDRPTANITPANSLNNTWPPASKTTYDPTIACRIAGANRTEANWLADTGESGDLFAARTFDADLVPDVTENVTIPAGVHFDIYGRSVTPGDTAWKGAVMLDAPVSAPLTITNSDGTTISQPVSATAQPNTDVRFVVRLNAVGQNLTGLTYTESGVLRLETGRLPLTLADGTSSTFAVLLRSPTLGANQTGSLTIAATGGLSATVDYLLTVASPWSIRRSDGSAIPANPITGTFQQAAGGAVFQVRIDANADTLENFSYTTDGIVTLPTGPVELGPLSPGESKILNIFLDTATLGAGQTGYAEIDFDANGVAVTTIRMEFDIEVIEAVLEASRARSRSRIR
jgi:hypothetical protein